MTTLESDVRAWDTKSAAAIGEVFDRYSSNPGFSGEIVAMIDDETTQRGATWLLKRQVETSAKGLDAQLAARVFGSIDGLDHWESKLHVLQCMSYITIPAVCCHSVATFLRECIVSDKKFVRAWAYTGFHELASQHDQFQDDVMAILIKGLESEKAGSVKVRIRKAVTKGF